MKNKLLSSLAVAGILAATSANAATYSSSLFYTLANSASSAYGANSQWPIISDPTGQYVTYTTPAQMLALPTAKVDSFVAAFNSLLQTSQCSASTVGSNGSVQFPSSSSTYCLSQTQQLYTTYLGLPITNTSAPSASLPAVVTGAVVPQVQRATSVQQATIISNVVSNIFSTRASARPGAQVRTALGEEKGMAAGDSASKLNGWFNASETKIGNSAAASSFDGNVSNALAGIDYMVSPKFVAGVSLGYDRVSIDYNFSAGSGLSSTGWMVAPYASYQITDAISVDGALGYAEGDADSRAPTGTTTQSYTRNFFALNLNGNYWKGDWQLTAKANYINAEEKIGSTNRMEQLRVGGQVGYWKNGVMPYASLTYVNDLNISTPFGAPASNDKDAWVAAVGVNLFSKGALSGGVSYSHEFERDNSKNNVFMANIGYRF